MTTMGWTLLHGMLLLCFGGLAGGREGRQRSGCSNAIIVRAGRCDAHDWLCGRVVDFEAVTARQRWGRLVCGKVRTQQFQAPSSFRFHPVNLRFNLKCGGRAVPRKSLHPSHAPSTPVAVCPVIRPLTDLSQKRYTPLVLATPSFLTTRLRWVHFRSSTSLSRCARGECRYVTSQLRHCQKVFLPGRTNLSLFPTNPPLLFCHSPT